MKIYYYILYIFAFMHAILPLGILYVFSDILYFFIYYVGGYRRKIIRKNLVNSFPDKSLDEIKHLERRFYHHLCDYFFETMKLLHISDKEMKKRMKFYNCELINDALKNKEPILLMLGHYGNWEWITSLNMWILPDADTVKAQVYRPLKDKAFDSFFLKLRDRFKTLCIPKDDVLRAIVRFRREGKSFFIAFMADQRPSYNNMHYWTTFLNQETSVLNGVERIAVQTGSCVIYLDVKVVKRGYYEAEAKLITKDPKKTGEFEITEKYIRMMEETILRDPAYWLWTHDRWVYKRKDIKH